MGRPLLRFGRLIPFFRTKRLGVRPLLAQSGHPSLHRTCLLWAQSGHRGRKVLGF